MPILAAALLIVVSALSGSVARSRQDTPQLETVRRPRIVTELSELLTHSPLAKCPKSDAQADDGAKPLRIGTWNIRAAQSAPVDMLAAEIRAMQVDVLALQEVDVRTRRGGFVDEPVELATALGLNYVFAASIKWDEGHYGLAVLSRWPLVSVERHRLNSTPEAEPRIVLDVTVCAAGRPLHLLNTHADRRTASRALGFADLRQIVKSRFGRGILVLGDLNEYPDAPGVRGLIDGGFVDLSADSPPTVGTGRVDYLLADPPLARIASTARVWTTDKSDHHAVLADLAW
ncbi:MAG: endonuclease/exonuclease/phosphatase family protein [Vicinamibacterales bacterium]